MSPPRDQVIAALAARLAEVLQGVDVRRRMFAGVPAPEQMPCLVVAGSTEQVNEEDAAGNPGKWKLQVGCYLWARDASDTGPVPKLLGHIDAIEDALRARTGEGGGWWTTLGGLVWHAALVGVDTLGDEGSADVGLALVRIEIACKPVR